jgi:hypothetical protein
MDNGQWIDGETAFEEVLRELKETGTVRPACVAFQSETM